MGKKLLTLAAMFEAITGLALIVHPAGVVWLLLGEEISGAGLALGRVAGISLLSFGVACWPRKAPTLPALRGMLLYNLLATIYLASLSRGGESAGKLLLAAIALHALFTLLLSRVWYTHPRDEPCQPG
jgi:hypothetical protein